MNAQLKDEFLLDPEVIFLNHGSFGACPRPVFESYQRWQRELERQPVEFMKRKSEGLLAQARGELAAFLGTTANNVVFVTNATVGVNTIARSLALGPHDEVLTSQHEYGALSRAWRFLSRKAGFKVIEQPVPLPLTTHADFVEHFWRGVTSNTRVIFLSHITSPTALIFPIQEICVRARAAGILTVIDGAHAPGQVSLSLDELGADFYTGNLHKWVCAPKGSAFLYARPERQALVEPLVVSWGWESDKPGPSLFIDHHEFQGVRDLSAFLAAPDAIRFQAKHNWGEVRRSCHALARYAQKEIVKITGCAPHHADRDEWFQQMAAAPLPEDVDVERLQQKLYNEYRIEIPVWLWNKKPFIRASIQAYNAGSEVDALLSALRKLL